MSNTQKAAQILELLRDLAIADSQAGYLSHLRHVVIDSRPHPARFAERAKPWQWEWAAQLAPALDDIMGLTAGHTATGPSPRPYVGPRLFWRTLARGHDKTTGIARALNFALGFSLRPLVIDHAAADRDQAALLVEAMKRELDLNPWLAERVTLTRNGATGPGGVLTILTSDAPSAAGRIPDLITCDEITHWGSRDLWDMLFSAVDKRDTTVVVVITNAGVKRSWQWDIKETAKAIPERWLVYEAPGRLDTWMSEENLAHDRKLLTPSEARRLLDNEWIDPAEESGYLSPADILACEELGRSLGLHYGARARRGVSYWASIDYGPKRDRTVLSVGHQTDSGLIVLDKQDVWQGSREDEIQVYQIRSWLKEARWQYPGLSLVVDPYELRELVQDLRGEMLVETFEARGGKSNYEMAEALRSLIVSRGIAWYPGAGTLTLPDGRVETLADELASLVIARTSYGYRFDHKATGHDDRAVSVGMLAVTLLARARALPFKAPPAVERPFDTSALAIRRPRSITAESRGLYGMTEK